MGSITTSMSQPQPQPQRTPTPTALSSLTFSLVKDLHDHTSLQKRKKHKHKPIYTASQKRHREQMFLVAVLALLVIITLVALFLAVWREQRKPKRDQNEVARENGGFWERNDLEAQRAPRVEVVQVDGGEAVWVWDWGCEDNEAEEERMVGVKRNGGEVTHSRDVAVEIDSLRGDR